MKTLVQEKNTTFIDMNDIEIVDKLLVKSESTPTISFKQVFGTRTKFIKEKNKQDYVEVNNKEWVNSFNKISGSNSKKITLG